MLNGGPTKDTNRRDGKPRAFPATDGGFDAMSLENFADASARHFDDATQLITHQRYDNAAYLLGYVVECAMKTVFSAGPLMKPQKPGHDLLFKSGRERSTEAFI